MSDFRFAGRKTALSQPPSARRWRLSVSEEARVKTPSPCPSPRWGEGTPELPLPLKRGPQLTPSPLGERAGVRGSSLALPEAPTEL